MRLICAIGIKPNKRTTLDGMRFVCNDGPIAHFCHELSGKWIGTIPPGGVEQSKEGGKAFRLRIPEQDREYREAPGLFAGPEVAIQSRMSLRRDPSAHAVAAHQHDKGGAVIDRRLQALKPQLAM